MEHSVFQMTEKLGNFDCYTDTLFLSVLCLILLNRGSSFSLRSRPVNSNGDVLECIHLSDVTNLTVTSAGKGTLDGNGQEWWYKTS